MPDNNQNRENLGPAERIINNALQYNDHLYHGRRGIVIPDNSPVGAKWLYVAQTLEEGNKVIYELRKISSGRRRNNSNNTTRVRLGILNDDGCVYGGNGRKVGEYRPAGLFPEVVAYVYKQIAEVWKLDNEFAAKWASYMYPKEHRDMKTVLAAFMLVQSRKGEAVKENGEVIFFDEDYRNVGEAMALNYEKDKDYFRPKLLLRVYDILCLPEIAQINRELGFGVSSRKPFLGRWTKMVHKWLHYREENPQLLEGLIKAGYRKTVMKLARLSGYKPDTSKFFELLRWKQSQAKDGHRTIAIGEAVKQAESWAGLTEEQICQKIVTDKPNYKRIISLVPMDVGITRAILVAAVESGCLSNADLIIHTPTLEDLGLLEVQSVKEKWQTAIDKANNTRAANIASRVKNKETQEKLEEASDNALQAAAEEVMKDMRIYFMIDVSSSMSGAIEKAKDVLPKLLQAFPQDKLHVCTFNTVGKEVSIKNEIKTGKPSAATVAHAFRGVQAGGGTDYAAAVRCLQKYSPKDGEDVLFVFIGDEGAANFPQAVRNSGLNPSAFGLIKIVDPRWPETRFAVQHTAASLQIPCFMIDEKVFEDVYTAPRVLQRLIASTPVGQTATGAYRSNRKTLIDEILDTPVLKKPIWAEGLAA